MAAAAAERPETAGDVVAGRGFGAGVARPRDTGPPAASRMVAARRAAA